VQIGTANYTNPAVAVDIAEGIESFCGGQGYTDVSEVINTLQTNQTYSVLKSWMKE
jgi:dihydroorotate dehydrogenase